MRPQVHDQKGDQHDEGHAPLHRELRPGRAHDLAVGGVDEDQEAYHPEAEKGDDPAPGRPE
jgi:hypothetical protein